MAVDRAAALKLANLDNHITFRFAELFAMCGETKRALDVLESTDVQRRLFHRACCQGGAEVVVVRAAIRRRG
jgi:hypothetical protein